MKPIKGSYFIIAILLLFNIIFSIWYLKNKNAQNEILRLKINEINNFWINELKIKDSLCLKLAMSDVWNIIFSDTLENRAESLIIFIPDDACWECVKSKLDLIYKLKSNINIKLFCPSVIKRRVILVIKENNYKDVRVLSSNKLISDFSSRAFYFVFVKKNKVFFFIDILSTNDLLERFLKQINRYDNI